MEADFLPPHLRKYVVEQHYEKYTSVDQAVWRYILRQLRDFLSKTAHECYLEGLQKTGIEVECIPKIEDISQALQKFGWRALPVSGFIPPAAFMELQALGVLPIASDMRSLDHLLYTPAPDIVHEAAGHAPILIHPEFSAYLRKYAAVAKKAIISKEDLDVYEAIRELSDIKENPHSSAEEITRAEKNLEAVGKSVTHVSEAAELSRMNWWTAEYGLIGDLKNPKIFGAGLLSSVGESRLCLSEKVQKIPLSVDCIKMSYDITEPQPQLFVSPDFQTLSRVLEEMSEQMAFKKGGLEGLQKAQRAKSVNTFELSSGIQCSGQVIEILQDENSLPIYIRMQGPCQLSFQDQELHGHGNKYHAEGFGTPVGTIKGFEGRCPSLLTDDEWQKINVVLGKRVRLEFSSGVVVSGLFINRFIKNQRSLVFSFKEASVEYSGRTLFSPEWGVFDMVLGESVCSVFGGPADRPAYGETMDFVAKRVPVAQFTEEEIRKQKNYTEVRRLRGSNVSSPDLSEQLSKVFDHHAMNFPQDWLLPLEILEIAVAQNLGAELKSKVEKYLQSLAANENKVKALIDDGLRLVGVAE